MSVCAVAGTDKHTESAAIVERTDILTADAFGGTRGFFTAYRAFSPNHPALRIAIE